MLIAVYPSKAMLQASIGEGLKYRETSLFGDEYRDDGELVVANRPHVTGIGREFFATVTMANGRIVKVK